MSQKGKSILPAIFGQILRKMRNRAGLSQEKLAFETGCNRTFVSFMERGLRQPSLTTIFKIGKALHVLPSEILIEVQKEFDPDGIEG